MSFNPETMRRLQEASRITLDPETVRRLQEASRITLDPETVRRLQDASRITLDPELVKRAHAALAVPIGQLSSLGAGVALELGEGRSEAVTQLASELLDADGTETELASHWLSGLSTTRQRRLLLLALAAITAVLDAVDAEANVQPPAHLVVVVYALVAIAVLLNEAIDGPGS